MYFLSLLLLILPCFFALDLRNDFNNFMEKYQKHYRDPLYHTEREHRFRIYVDNYNRVAKLNSLGNAKFQLNKFADLTPEEFSEFYTIPASSRCGNNQPQFPSHRYFDLVKPNDDLPESFNWKSKGAVGPVRNQGSAGSCWAFSTVENVAGQWALAKKQFVELSSEQYPLIFFISF